MKRCCQEHDTWNEWCHGCHYQAGAEDERELISTFIRDMRCEHVSEVGVLDRVEQYIRARSGIPSPPGAISLMEAKVRRACRICGVDFEHDPSLPQVYNYGREHAQRRSGGRLESSRSRLVPRR